MNCEINVVKTNIYENSTIHSLKLKEYKINGKDITRDLFIPSESTNNEMYACIQFLFLW